jgi:hypothetical protein
VIVLVDEWVDESAFHVNGQEHPSEMVPKALDLEDGRSVPVCVVKVDRLACDDTASISQMRWPNHIIGGGYPLIIDSQGQRHNASVGCLVTDGHTKYAITNRHVAGRAGDVIETLLHGTPTRIGVTSALQLTRLPFTDVYPEFPSRKTYTNLDIGLIQLDDAKVWTSDVVNPIGPIGEMQDVNVSSLSLDLIDEDVEAFGSASGHITGKIRALFYRYKTTAGYDFVTDFLIAPSGDAQTKAGDSGTVWVIPADPKSKTPSLPRPLAVQWGAQTFAAGDSRNQYHFSLASSLSNICQLLDVELIQAHNLGATVTWGSTGHYTIGAYACDLLESPGLKSLMLANKERISFDNARGALDPAEVSQKLRDAKANNDFVPLADVPDIIWKNNPKDVTGGRDTQFNSASHRWSGPEHPNHFADIDEPLPDDGSPDAGKTLLQLSDQAAFLTVANWTSYFTALGHTKGNSQGLLPFRAWQIYKKMVEFVTSKDVPSFLASAGILSHYIGDACQPLHGSYHSDGYSDQSTKAAVKHRDGTEGEKNVWPGQGVHGTYEDGMVDKYSTELYAMVLKLSPGTQLSKVTGGQEAGQLVVQLMRNSQAKLPPDTIIQAYIDAGGKKNSATYKALFDSCGEQTGELWLMGAATLASLWESAWTEGKGNKIPAGELREYDAKDLIALYQDPEFLPSRYLSEIQSEL